MSGGLRLGRGLYALLCLSIVASVDALVRPVPEAPADDNDAWLRAPAAAVSPAVARDGSALPMSDGLFAFSQPPAPAPKPAVVDVAPPPPPPPPPPQAPAMPFQYLGRMDDENGVRIFLQRGPDVFVVAPGDNVDPSYRLDSIDDDKLLLTYLPMQQKQTISLR